MATNTYTPLANITLGSSAASVTFSSISGSYRDLILVCNITASANYTQPSMRINSDTGSNYSTVRMLGDGAATSSTSYTETALALFNTGLDNATTALITLNIMDYSATDKHKSVLFRSNMAYSSVSAYASRWASTSAITSISIGTFIGSYTQPFAAGSTFSLFGVAA